MSYIALVIIGLLLVCYMFYSHMLTINKELKKQNTQLHSQIIKEKTNSNIKEFQAMQKAKKEIIKKENNEPKKYDINLSTGSHTISF